MLFLAVSRGVEGTVAHPLSRHCQGEGLSVASKGDKAPPVAPAKLIKDVYVECRCILQCKVHECNACFRIVRELGETG